MRHPFALLALLALGCSAEPLPPGELLLVTGHETDAWSAEPAPREVSLTKLFDDGTSTAIAEKPAPAEQFELDMGGIGRYDIVGADEGGTAQLRGRTLWVDPVGLAGGTLPVLVGRTDRFTRPDGELSTDQGQHPPVVVLSERFLFALGANDPSDGWVQSDGYDLGAWGPVPSAPRLGCHEPPCTFESVALVDGALLVGVGSDWAIWYDISVPASGDLVVPNGIGSYAEVAGGRTVRGSDGTAYIVGATRSEGPTAGVLRIKPDGEVSAVPLSAARAGAAARWVGGRGLLVVGGSDSAAGAELLADGTDSFVPLDFPPDATTGAALVELDATRVARLGGRLAGAPAPSVELALGCSSACTLGDAGATLELDAAQAFRIEPGSAKPGSAEPGSAEPGSALLVGEGPDGSTQALRWQDGAAQPIALREPRRGASAALMPTGHVALVGGVRDDGSAVRSVELWLP